jgi:hypothetical protein
MNAFRKSSLFVLFGFVALLALSLTATTAEAGGCHKGYGFHKSYGHHSVSYPSYPSVYNHNACYGPSCYWPTYQVAKPISYPVTYYDCYGQPYIVWQTSYSYLP